MYRKVRQCVRVGFCGCVRFSLVYCAYTYIAWFCLFIRVRNICVQHNTIVNFMIPSFLNCLAYENTEPNLLADFKYKHTKKTNEKKIMNVKYAETHSMRAKMFREIRLVRVGAIYLSMKQTNKKNRVDLL